jgi:ssDNA-binding Zn-finger/Zn-ribbon topoisomerase 1
MLLKWLWKKIKEISFQFKLLFRKKCIRCECYDDEYYYDINNKVHCRDCSDYHLLPEYDFGDWVYDILPRYKLKFKKVIKKAMRVDCPSCKQYFYVIQQKDKIYEVSCEECGIWIKYDNQGKVLNYEDTELILKNEKL